MTWKMLLSRLKDPTIALALLAAVLGEIQAQSHALMAALVILGLAVGCTTFSTSDPAARLVPQYLTAKLIEQGATEEERLAKAQRVKRIASEAKTWIDLDGLPLDLLEQRARQRVAGLNLSTADLMLANALIASAIQYLQTHQPAEPGAARSTTVNQLLDWIIQAAELYGA